MARRGGLGTNLDALIPTSLTVAGQEVATQNEVDVNLISANPRQPRQHFDVDALNDCGVPLAIAAHSNMISVAEHAMFMLLALSKNVFYYDKFARKADWTTRWDIRAWDVANKNILIIGFGRIGSKLVKRALAFDMNVFVYDPYIDASEITKSGAKYVDSYLDILKDMDAVSLHCPKNEETTDMFSEREFNMMKNSSFLINCARGGIVNEKALYDARDQSRNCHHRRVRVLH